ncbi:MAG: sulfotransferase domain-containing protein [Acidobacteria bacterium]|nr:sulfotransferase domain-containing protein [Acidobacteriota bacterium]
MDAIRLYHLTFYKCGSQWVRDILSDPRIIECSGHSLAATGIDLQTENWPALRPGQFASPLYSTGTGAWRERSHQDDRAFVVIRDPRDIVVSLVYSVSFSHTPSTTTRLLRGTIADSSPRNRLRLGMFLLAQWADYLRSWKQAPEIPNVFLTKYGRLVSDLPDELERFFDFLKWPVPRVVRNAVAHDHSFEVLTGRARGVENQFSHRRKGISGDWRNHFDRGLGELFESVFPQLLVELGYEQNCDWWKSLPVSLSVEPPSPESQRSQLLAVLEEHHTELTVLRAAAGERLRDIHSLHEIVEDRDRQRSQLIAALDERLHDIHSLHETLEGRERQYARQLAELRTAADERLAAMLANDNAHRKLEKSFSWRFGFKPLHALASLFHD